MEFKTKMNIYRYIKVKGVTYDLSKIKLIDELLFINYLKINGVNYNFFSKLNHFLSFWLIGDFNDDVINAYNYFVYRHNKKIKKQQVNILNKCRV